MSTKQKEPPREAIYKLWVLFLDGNDRVFYSYPRNEANGTALDRLRNLVLTRWNGKVGVAKIYRHGVLKEEFLSRSNFQAFKPVEPANAIV